MVAPYVPISDIVPWTQAIAGLNQSIFSTTWTANDASDILVYSRAPGIPTSDVLQLIPSSQYTVQFIGSDNTVQITFGTPYIPPQYNIITIMRATPSEFLNLYTNTNFTPSMLNGDFETLTQVDQQNQLYWQQIVPRYNNSATVNVPIDTILPVAKANEFWIKNSTNTAWITATLGSGGEFPVLGPFVLYATDSAYPEGVSLGSLTNGILAQTVVDTVSTPYVLPIPLTVPNGGTGLSTITPNAVLLGGTTNTAPIVPLADLGDVGEVLTSSGPSAPPSWQPVSGGSAFSNINVQVFASSGIYTPSSGMTLCTIECMGAGGGGAGVENASGIIIAGGGGGGGYSRLTTNSSAIGASQVVTIGSGGAGGASGTNNGVAGGNTSVGTLCIANGGSGGINATRLGGAGGAAGTGNIAATGPTGLSGLATSLNTTTSFGGGGASTQWGGGGVEVSHPSGGAAGTGYGSGGSSGSSSNSAGAQAGGNGANGYVIITEYLT